MRLSNASLDRLPGHIRRPGYDRSKVRPGVVHLGIGAFHRAHLAAVIDASGTQSRISVFNVDQDGNFTQRGVATLSSKTTNGVAIVDGD